MVTAHTSSTAVTSSSIWSKSEMDPQIFRPRHSYQQVTHLNFNLKCDDTNLEEELSRGKVFTAFTQKLDVRLCKRLTDSPTKTSKIST